MTKGAICFPPHDEHLQIRDWIAWLSPTRVTMADIFVSYTRADQEIVGRIVALLEAQGWSVWWDTRIAGGERWDATIEREIKAARCVVVVWTPQSIDREWVREEADYGRKRGILIPVLIGLDEPPFGFGRIQARNLTGWDDATKRAAAKQFLMDVRHCLERTAPGSSPLPQSQANSRRETRPRTSRVQRAKVQTLVNPELSPKLTALLVAAARKEADFETCLRAPGAGNVRWFKDISFGPEMVVVPAGSFTMGSKDRSSEQPLHKVSIERPFAVGRFAVTFDEWEASGLPHRPGDEGWGRGKHPVINVSWEDAKTYTEWLSRKTRKAYRLLSEAEWEYVARAGTTTGFWPGDSISTSQANFNDRERTGRGQFLYHTVPVDDFRANPWGLYQVHGNVWEWCEDGWHDDYKDAPKDGSVWQGGDVSARVLRGGSWNSVPDILRSAVRNWDRVNMGDAPSDVELVRGGVAG
jgi:formylglycine-generating enzyme required for sulfatase activity